MELSVTTLFGTDRAEMTLAGSLDLVSREQFLDAANFALAQNSMRTLVVDLWQVTFIDSSGLGALTQLLRHASDLGVTFSVCRPTDKICKLMAITGLNGVIPVT